MTRFIFFCMAFVALSFIAVPVFTGISKERDAILASSKSSIPAASPLSFEEIYEIAGADNTGDGFDASAFNDITPAAGGEISDQFSTGFSNREDSALENTALALPDDEGVTFE